MECIDFKQYVLLLETQGTPEVDVTGTCDRSGDDTCSDVQKDILRFVMVGMTGTGKSATGNSIAGLALKTLDMAYAAWNKIKPFLSRSGSKSITLRGERKDITLNGRQIAIVDTPGFFDTRFDDKTTITEIMTCLNLIAPGPHAILMVAQTGRQTKEVLKALDVMKKVFGEELVNYVIVVFTHGDDIKRDGETIDHFVARLKGPYKELLQEADNRYVLFDNTLDPTSKDNEEQVRQLIDMADKIVDKNHGRYYRNDFLEEAHRLMQKEEERQARELEEEKKKKEDLEKKAQENEILKAELKKKQAEKEVLEQEKKNIADRANQAEAAVANAHQRELEEVIKKMEELDRKVTENEHLQIELKEKNRQIQQLERERWDLQARAQRVAVSERSNPIRDVLNTAFGVINEVAGAISEVVECFASTSTVLVQDDDGQITSKSLEDLAIGDLVESYDPDTKRTIFSSVYYIQYKDDNENMALLRRLYYTDGDGVIRFLALQANHMLYANILTTPSVAYSVDFPPPTPTMSKDVQIGDILWIKNASGHLCPTPVVKIDEVSSHVRHPLTFSHYIIVDGVLASVHMHNEWLLRQVTAPLRVLYNISPSLNDIWLTKKMVNSWDWVEIYLLE